MSVMRTLAEENTMNGVQQQERRTAILELKADLEDLARAWDAELAEKLETERTERMTRFDTERRYIDTAVGAERTHRLKLADEQRNYVDGQDNSLSRIIKHEQGRADTFYALTFWGRLRWLFTGRRG